MDRVTDRYALHEPDDGLVTRFAKWKAGLVTLSHALTKNRGEIVDARWNVSNLGDAPGVAQIFIGNAVTGAQYAFSNRVTIEAGLRNVGLIVLWTIPADFPSGLHNMELVMQDDTVPPAVRIISHPFTLTVQAPPPTGPILVASGAAGQPEIS
jgi:hypothetical protein